MESVFDRAREWAEANFAQLPGQIHTADSLEAECCRWLSEYPGASAKKRLFVYAPTSPDSVVEFTTASRGSLGMILAGVRLDRVVTGGGMLLGVDFSRGGEGEFTPLVVCEPTVPKGRVLERLKDAGVTEVIVQYDGSSDSGCIEWIDATRSDNTQVELSGGTKELVEEYVYTRLPPGWEIDDGSVGEVVFDVAAGTVTFEHNIRTYRTSSWEE